MRAGRLFLLLCGLTAGGIAVARPDAVRPFATRYIAPLLASQGIIPAVAEPAAPSVQATAPDTNLPSFVPGAAGLSFDAGGQQSNAGSDSTSLRSQSNSQNALPSGTQGASPPPAATATLVPTSAAPDSSSPRSETAAKPITLSVEPIPPRTPPDGGVGIDGSDQGGQAAKPPPIPAKQLFGAATTAAPLAARAIGSYSRGCLAGAVALPTDGPAWQAMRLSRNRNWGHPKLISLVERLAVDAKKLDGWPGLLVGDISQPRGGPMLTGHASHQLGLDADVWLTPMPAKRFTRKEREEISAISMLDDTDLAVDPKRFTDAHVKLIKRAASYPEVERVLVHPAIKKALCEAAGPDRKWLGKVRPIGGHYFHFHIRIGCPPGSTVCKPQVATTGEDGCTKEVQDWLARLAPPKTPPPPKPPGYKPPPPPPPLTMASLPDECRAVLESGPDGVRTPVTTLKEDVPMGGVAEKQTGAFIAGAAMRQHIPTNAVDDPAN